MKLYEFLKKINNLKRTPRMGWLESGISSSEAEDVAQHSFETATITLLLAGSLESEVDNERALKMAIVHDWAESITGDLSKGVSDQIGSEVKGQIEEEVMENLLTDEVPDREEYLGIWREYNELRSREAKLVRVADKLSILFEASELFRRGERSEKLRKIWETTMDELEPFEDSFPVLEDFVRELEENFSSGSV